MANVDYRSLSPSPPPAYSEQEERNALTPNSSPVRERINAQQSLAYGTAEGPPTEEWLEQATQELENTYPNQHNPPDSNASGNPTAGNGGLVVAPLRIHKKKPSGGGSANSSEKPLFYKEAASWGGTVPAEPMVSAPAYTARVPSNASDECRTQSWQGLPTDLPNPYTGSGLPTPPFTPDRNQFSFEYLPPKADDKRALKGTDWTGLKVNTVNRSQPHTQNNANANAVGLDRRTMYTSSNDILNSVSFSDVRRHSALPPNPSRLPRVDFDLSYAYGKGNDMNEADSSQAYSPNAFYNSVVSSHLGPPTRSTANNNSRQSSQQLVQMPKPSTHGFNARPTAPKRMSHLPHGAAYPSNPIMTSPSGRNPYSSTCNNTYGNGQQSVMQHPAHGPMPSTEFNPYH